MPRPQTVRDAMRKTCTLLTRVWDIDFPHVYEAEAMRMRAEMDEIAVAQQAAEDDDAGINSPFGALDAAE